MGGETINTNPLPEIRVRSRDVLKALGDVVMSIVRHLPPHGYSSSHRRYEAHPDVHVTPVKDPYSDCLNEVQVHGFLYDERAGR